MSSFEQRTKCLDIPTKIADHIIDKAADQYRKLCGANDLLMHKNRIVPFEYFLSLHLAAIEIQAALAAHEARMML